MDRLILELHRPACSQLLESIRHVYNNVHDLEHFGSSSLESLSGLPIFEELVHRQLCAAGVAGCVLDAAESASAKETAKAHFRSGQLEAACSSYSRALQMEHEREAGAADEAASALYADRAACLLRMVPPAAEAARADCTAAISCNTQNHKAWYRRALAWEAAGHPEAALADAQQAAELVAEHGWSSPQLESLLQRVKASLMAAPPGDAAGTLRQALPGLQPTSAARPAHATSYPTHFDAAFSAAAPDLTVRASKGAGRMLVAARQLNAGQVVVQEEPFVAVLSKAQRSQICSVCFSPLRLNPVYCRACPLAAYCSLECREADADHVAGGLECGLPWPLLLPDDARLALRLAVKLAQEQEPGDSSSAQHVSQLEQHWGKAPFDSALPTVLLACLAFSCWSHAHSHSQAAQHSRAVTVGGVLRALSQIAVNGVALTHRSHASAAERLGLAIYPVVSLMNHSCIPAISLDWQGRRLVARTLKSLQPGDEVALTYGPQKGRMLTSIRQQQLESQYHFECRCPACDGQHGKEQCMVGLACPREDCEGVIVPAHACQPGLLSNQELPAGTGSGRCSNCERCIPEVALKELRDCAADFDSAMQQLRDLDSSDNIHPDTALSCCVQLEACLEVRRRLLHRHNELLGLTWDALADARAASSGQWAEAAAACSRSIEILRAHYPADALPVAYQQLKCAGLLRRAGAHEEAAEQEAGALRALQLHYSSESHAV